MAAFPGMDDALQQTMKIARDAIQLDGQGMEKVTCYAQKFGLCF